MMTNHVCEDNWVRCWRMILALVENDPDAYTRVIDEIALCPTCLVNALNHAMGGWSTYIALGVGGHAEAADLAAQEIQRYLT